MGNFAEVLSEKLPNNTNRMSSGAGKLLEGFNESITTYKGKRSSGVAATRVNPNKKQITQTAAISFNPRNISKANTTKEETMLKNGVMRRPDNIACSLDTLYQALRKNMPSDSEFLLDSDLPKRITV